jgi:hypothetical protein
MCGFSDGSTAEKVGGELTARDISAVTADATGRLAAWVETADDGVGELVVYDSRRAVVVARVSGGPAIEAAPPDVVAVDDQAVYWSQRPGTGDPLLRYDVATGEQEAVDLPSLAYVADVADGEFAYGTGGLRGYRVVVASPVPAPRLRACRCSMRICRPTAPTWPGTVATASGC